MRRGAAVEFGSFGWAGLLLWAALGGCGLDGAADAASAGEAAPLEASASEVVTAPSESSEPPAASERRAGSEALDALPWAERIGLERAMAEADPAHAPRRDETGPALGVPGGVTASFTASGAAVSVGGREVRLRASALRRGEAVRALEGGAPEVAGPEVRTARGAGVTEWWRSLPSGLEHGLTLAERPAGEGALTIEVTLEGLTPRTESPDSISLVDEGGALVARYGHLVVLDAAGARVPATMRAEGGAIAVELDDAAARYPLVVDPLLVGVQEATLLAPDGPENDYLGYSVALTSDGSRALVGAPFDDTAAGTDAGSARVFLRSGTNWTQEATLLAPDGAANDYLGWSVALTSDGSRALVGAYADDTVGGSNAGSARVFVRSGSTWTQEATLLAPDAAMGDQFGRSVALTADGSRALVGAHVDDTAGGGDAGSVRVFVRSGMTWTQEATLLAPDGAADDRFGGSVALTADGSRALVGAPGDGSAGGTNVGSARVFVRSGSTWTNEATLLASDGAVSDSFGVSVAITADGSRALVGEPGDDTAGGNAGAAGVFVRSGSTWTQEAMLLARAPFSGFGRSVALTADGSRALVGEPGDGTAGGTDAGAAGVFVRSGSTWTNEATLLASDGAGGDEFGSSIALTEDGSRALVGAFSDDTGVVMNAGSARVFLVGPAQPNGSACTADAFCLSGFCTDGVCCSTRCGPSATDCEACSAALTGGADGTCAPLTAALAPTVTCRAAAGPCDTAEVCTSTSAACPADAFRPSTELCRSASGSCDAAEFCTGTGAACPTNTGSPAAAGSVCRPAAGGCDSPEVCDGLNPLCPGDAKVPLGTVCRASVGACDVAESCDGVSAACPTDVVVAGGARCRDAADVCDVPENCDGLSGACPTDRFRPSTEPCRALFGACDVADFCTGSAATCPDRRRSAGETCRAAVGPCDTVEACDGSSVDCPADVLQAAGTVCAAAGGGPCDADDVCTGSSADCPPRYLAGVECRTVRGACDVAEVCSGGSTSCPPDTVLSLGVSCRPGVGPCDLGESCDGVNPACPTDAFAAPGSVCRAASGECDVAETCTGLGASCPADGFAPVTTPCGGLPSGACDEQDTCAGTTNLCVPRFVSAGTMCRAASGECDVAEACTGTTAACPEDAFEPATTTCRSARGLCDVPEQCSGSAAACPADVVLAADTVCRATSGDCDREEVCDGFSPACPRNDYLVPGVVCRAAVGECDVAEACTGTTADCPADRFAAVTTACGGAPAGACDAQDHCAGTSADCESVFLAGVECRASRGECDSAEVCAGGEAGCPPDSLLSSGVVCRTSTDLDCDPLESCDGVSASCPADVTMCGGTDAGMVDPDGGAVADAGGSDAAVPADAGGALDAGGPPPTPAQGCACRASARAEGAPVGLAALGMLLGALVRRRR